MTQGKVTNSKIVRTDNQVHRTYSSNWKGKKKVIHLLRSVACKAKGTPPKKPTNCLKTVIIRVIELI